MTPRGQVVLPKPSACFPAYDLTPKSPKLALYYSVGSQTRLLAANGCQVEGTEREVEVMIAMYLGPPLSPVCPVDVCVRFQSGLNDGLPKGMSTSQNW